MYLIRRLSGRWCVHSNIIDGGQRIDTRELKRRFMLRRKVRKRMGKCDELSIWDGSGTLNENNGESGKRSVVEYISKRSIKTCVGLWQCWRLYFGM